MTVDSYLYRRIGWWFENCWNKMLWPIWELCIFDAFTIVTSQATTRRKVVNNTLQLGNWKRTMTTIRRDINYTRSKSRRHYQYSHITRVLVHCDLLSLRSWDWFPGQSQKHKKKTILAVDAIAIRYTYEHCVKQANRPQYAMETTINEREGHAKMWQSKDTHTHKRNSKHWIGKSKLAQISRILAFHKWLAQSLLLIAGRSFTLAPNG